MTGRFSFNLKRLFGGYFTIFGFAAGTAGMVLAHGGSILNYAYPLLATVLALFLFAMQRNIYLSFVWLIYLFTPLVRRLVDFHTLYHKVSPVMFTPLLVTLIAFIPLLRNPRFMLQRNLSDFLLILVVFIYGLAVGLALNSLAATVYDFLNFFVPFGFGLAFMADSSGYLRNRASFLSTVMFGLLLISIYGIYQFRNMPPWDAYWLRQSGFGSAGPAIANQIRLFGPSNSPGTYGFILMGSLVFALVVRGPMKILAAGVGFPAFGLSLVRSGWIGWAVAAVFLAMTLGGKARARLILLGIGAVVIAYPLVTVGPIADQLNKRFATFHNIQQDGSYLARQQIYETDTITALTQPIGLGFGGLANRSNSGGAAVTGIDSGVLEVPMYFGWAFGALFTVAIFRISLRVLVAALRSRDSISKAAGALFLVLILENVGGQIFAGATGFLIWISAGLALGPVKAGKAARVAQRGQADVLIGPRSDGEQAGLPAA
jgi:hypothetical protein